jgi:mycoredoxin
LRVGNPLGGRPLRIFADVEQGAILHLPGNLFHLIVHLPMKLTVYTAPWCRDCHVAKRWLAQNNIFYQEINIEETPGAAEEVMQRTGKRAIPQFVIDGSWVQPYIPGEGFKYREMAELFGVSE